MDDFDFSNLPDDPAAAFVAVEQALRNDLAKKLKNESDKTVPYLQYMRSVKAAAEAFNLDLLKGARIPNLANTTNSAIEENFKDFSAQISGIVVSLRITQAQGGKQYSVGLTEPDKIKIRHFVEQIKLIVDGANISTAKKDALLRKINAFLGEVDKIRTSLAVFSDLTIGLAQIGGEATKELEPARKWVDSIARLFGHYRDIQDAQRALPPPQKRLEPPRRSESGSK